MCKSFLEIKNNKLIATKGIFRKGHFVICLECGILKFGKKRAKGFWVKRF